MADHTKVQTTGLDTNNNVGKTQKSDAQVAYDVLVQEAEATKRENRIEALRAASRVVAGIYARGGDLEVPLQARVVTLDLAEQFARWIEKGER